MSNEFFAKQGWGPEARRAAICLTFDNFGEACDLEVGVWGDKPIGQHHTAAFVPQLIEVLGDVKGTYFIEASNAEIYPDAIERWHRSGNEVGLHAWRHEFWAKCDSSTRRQILRKSLAAMEAIGIRPSGFRPPGGEVPAGVWEEFREAGLLYCSDLSSRGIDVFDGVVSLPFEWQAVDAYYFEDVAGPLRVTFGHEEAGYSPDHWAEVIHRIAADVVSQGSQATLIFHPHLLSTDPRKLAVLRDFVNVVGKNRDIWLPRAGDLARFVAEQAVPAGRAPVASR